MIVDWRTSRVHVLGSLILADVQNAEHAIGVGLETARTFLIPNLEWRLSDHERKGNARGLENGPQRCNSQCR